MWTLDFRLMYLHFYRTNLGGERTLRSAFIVRIMQPVNIIKPIGRHE